MTRAEVRADVCRFALYPHGIHPFVITSIDAWIDAEVCQLPKEHLAWAVATEADTSVFCAVFDSGSVFRLSGGIRGRGFSTRRPRIAVPVLCRWVVSPV